MKPVLIGSRALSYWTGMQVKETTDWDVISEYPIQGTEHHPLTKLNNAQMIQHYSSDDHQMQLPDGTIARIMSMFGLAVMKRSHLWRDLSFGKHITHYHKYGLADVMISLQQDNDLKVRTRMTMEEYPRKNPNLMQSKDDFFSDGVKKLYDHDWLHSLYAYNEYPMYTRMLRQNDMAWCEKDKWESFSLLEQYQCVAEEVYVIATERFMIPNEWEFSAKLAYTKALEKVCTTLCSGWFRDFAIDCYPEIFNMFSATRFEMVYNSINQSPENSRIYHKGN